MKIPDVSALGLDFFFFFQHNYRGRQKMRVKII